MTQRARALSNAGVWVLAVLLAAVFLVAGLSKLTGAGMLVPGLPQTATMQAFPPWIRVVVGVVEVLCAIGLLLPRLAGLSAVLLALLMFPAMIAQRASGEPGAIVPALLIVLLLFVAWQRNPEVVRDAYRAVVQTPHPILREGAIAGIIGATCIAVWFFLIDLVAGRPLFTPATLGRALFSIFGPVPAGESQAIHIAAYTVFHYAAFIVVGIVVALALYVAGRESSLLLGFVILFVAFEVGFYAFVALLQEASALGAFAWYQVMAGNLIAAAAMGTYLWRAHPALRDQFTHALDAPR